MAIESKARFTALGAYVPSKRLTKRQIINNAAGFSKFFVAGWLRAAARLLEVRLEIVPRGGLAAEPLRELFGEFDSGVFSIYFEHMVHGDDFGNDGDIFSGRNRDSHIGYLHS